MDLKHRWNQLADVLPDPTPLLASLRPGSRDLFRPAAHRTVHTTGRPFVYLPWRGGAAEARLAQLGPRGRCVEPLPFFVATGGAAQRARITAYVLAHPEGYRQLALRVLAPLRGSIAGVLFSSDLSAPLRQAAHACRELEIPTVLVPEEPLLRESAECYVDHPSGADSPLCDRVLCWGVRQRELFTSRGVEGRRLEVVGSPRLDAALHYTPALERAAFARRHGLDAARPFVLFAAQRFESLRHPLAAETLQRRAIADLTAVCAERSLQLLVRWPGASGAASALECLFHASAVFSIDSTLLLDGALMGRPAVAMPYFDTGAPWRDSAMAHALCREDLDAIARDLDGAAQQSHQVRGWAERFLSAGRLDGASAARIRSCLERLDGSAVQRDIEALQHLFADRATSSGKTACFYRGVHPSRAHLEAMLGFRRLLHDPGKAEAQTADVFVKWGIAPSRIRRAHDRLARALHRPQLVVEDGFLRSVDIGLSGTPGLSIIVDTRTAYYDATRPSRLEDRLNGATELDAAQRTRARSCIEQIRSARLSKYNHAPDRPDQYGPAPRVLLVDQRHGDESVARGLSSERSFRRMVQVAASRFPTHTLVVKRHPDATRGGKGSYLHDELLRSCAPATRLQLVPHEVNPHSLFDQVEEVLVVTSGMGFEALLAGRRVHCFGVPFYAGWGLTEDHVAVPRRLRTRTLEDVFHFACIESSRYYDPERRAAGEIEQVIRYLATHRAR